MDDGWTLSELVGEAAAVLRGYAAAANGQVKAIPDERAVRYYASLGLLDRPAAMRGRTALYGRRHLAQLVAIKRLQAVGKSLHDLAAIVPALDDDALARASGIEVPRAAPPVAARVDFWRGAPVAAPREDARTDAPTDAPIDAPAALTAQLALVLAPGVTLTFTPARDPSDADADALLRAATALVAELRRRHLIPASGNE
ncbi:MAG: MerR family transcriptional regulator [Deltaproteobacteria bacterium]|nr:MerR family transcriptional regulator [Deltaproteobacteria bacterium]